MNSGIVQMALSNFHRLEFSFVDYPKLPLYLLLFDRSANVNQDYVKFTQSSANTINVVS